LRLLFLILLPSWETALEAEEDIVWIEIWERREERVRREAVLPGGWESSLFLFGAIWRDEIELSELPRYIF
jgi:hypothetical protein